MNADRSDPKTNDKFFDITKDFMSYFDQLYIKTCFRQVWKIVKCKFNTRSIPIGYM